MDKELRRVQAGPQSVLVGGEGETLLLLHGIPGSSHTWEQAGTQLSKHFRIIIPDLMGFGHSSVPAHDYYMEAQANALHDLLARLGISRMFVGAHDFGGPVAFTLMRLYPALDIRAMIVSATNLFTDTYIPPPLRLAGVPLLGDAVFHALAGNRAGLRMMYLAATRNRSVLQWSSFRRHLTDSCVDLTRQIFQRSLADLIGNYRPIEQMLASVTLPALVLWGANDPFFATSVGERTHQALKGSRFKVYPGTGHFVPEEQPTAVAADILSFLSGLRSEANPEYDHGTPSAPS